MMIAGKLDHTSDPQIVAGFCKSVSMCSDSLDSSQVDTVKLAYSRFSYSSSYSAEYFAGLRDNKIDIRKMILGRITEDWFFDNPYDGAETWDYYLYLASLDHPDSYEAISEKIRNSEDPNLVSALLDSLSGIQSDKSKEIIEQYVSDSRWIQGHSGPVMQLSDKVEILLDSFNSESGEEPATMN